MFYLLLISCGSKETIFLDHEDIVYGVANIDDDDNNGIEETLEYTFINFQRESKKIVSRHNFLGQKIQKTYKGYHLIKYKDGSTSLVYKD